MTPETGPEGVFVISWSQTRIEGRAGAPVSALEQGSDWAWAGDAVRIDGVTGIALAPGESWDAMRRRAAAGARRLVGRTLVDDGLRAPFVKDTTEFDRAFIVSDGSGTWVVSLIDVPEIPRPLLLFAGEAPPAGQVLKVAEGVGAPSLPLLASETSEGVVCFTPGTLVETSGGSRPVEDLVAGDKVLTKDNGPQDVLWAGSRIVSGARLYAMPELRPVRILQEALGTRRPTGDLVVSPDHRVLVSGPAALALWGEREVLAAARDLVDDKRILRDMGAKSVTYIHLMLPAHNILWANGVETESFHPAAASLDSIAEDERLRLYDVMPELEFDATDYGPMSRRVLSHAEAALIAAVT